MTTTTAPHERLMAARLALGLDLETIARRTGVREPLLQAMEHGRWHDLPHGLYGRAAIRSYASALRIDADGFLADCEPHLVPLEDPIAALARMRGLRAHETAAASSAAPKHPAPPADTAVRRPGAKALAIVMDACAIAIMLACLIAVTSIWIEVPPSGLRHTAGPFAVMGMLFAGSYYVVFAGLGGRTPGDWIAFAGGTDDGPSGGGGHAARRALRSLLRDARMITILGRGLGALTTHHDSETRRRGDTGSVDGERLAF